MPVATADKKTAAKKTAADVITTARAKYAASQAAEAAENDKYHRRVVGQYVAALRREVDGKSQTGDDDAILAAMHVLGLTDEKIAEDKKLIKRALVQEERHDALESKQTAAREAMEKAREFEKKYQEEIKQNWIKANTL